METSTYQFFSDPFLDGYSQATITENTRLTSAAMREHDQRRSSDTRDYLHKLISDSQWNNATTALFLDAVIFDSLLNEIVSYLHASISFLTFLPTPLRLALPSRHSCIKATWNTWKLSWGNPMKKEKNKSQNILRRSTRKSYARYYRAG